MKLSRAAILITLGICIRGVSPALTSALTTATLIGLITTLASLILLFSVRRQIQAVFIQRKKLVKHFVVYGVFVLVYSCFVARTYEQWRYVSTVFLPTLLLPFFTIIGGRMDCIQSVVKFLFYAALPLSIFLYFSEVGGMADFSHYVAFLYFLLLMIPYLGLSKKVLLLALAVISILSNIDNRSNIFNFIIVAVILLFTHVFGKALLSKIFGMSRAFFIFVPIVMLLLGIAGVFNVFKFGDSFGNAFAFSYADSETVLTRDTRTGIFKDALSAIDSKNAYVFGISGAGLYKTELIDVNEDYFDTLKLGRMGNEVGILEYLLRGGIIYVVLTFLLYYYASGLAISRSRNSFCLAMGLFISFRWFFLFIESQPVLNLVNLADFLMIGMCLNPAFRRLRDEDIKLFFRQAFRFKLK